MTFRLVSGDCLDALAEMPEASVDAVVTDPPYGLSAEPDAAEVLRHWLDGDDYQHRGGGFMGKTWDSFVPGPKVWAECHRVLKPGGHLLAFFGTRTYDLGAMAIRLAGFEVRDCLAWMYGSGFPKSLDVSKAIDKARDAETKAAAEVARWLVNQMERKNVTRRDVSEHFGAANIAQQWTTYWTDGAVKPRVPKWDQWQELKTWLDLSDEMDGEVWRLNGKKGQPGENWAKREVVGTSENGIAGGTGQHAGEAGAYGFAGTYDLTAPATPAAQKWQGWGTALKPAFEPIILARKPLIGTVAENVTRFGTGALNVDGCRVEGAKGDGVWGTSNATVDPDRKFNASPDGAEYRSERHPAGRWPANLVLDDQAAAMLDEQSGEAGGGFGIRGSGKSPNTYGGGKGYAGTLSETGQEVGYGDTGGASRFFYQAKASRAERNAGLDDPLPNERFRTRRCTACQKNVPEAGACGCDADIEWVEPQPTRNPHPTVKPIDLMRWLVRLVTPPGGTVLDPFTGSGTTGIAAGLEGFDFVGIEREAEYREIAEARLKWWADKEGDTAEILRRAGLAEKERKQAEAVGQVSLFDEAA